MGWADEVGCGANRNLVVSPGAGDDAWLAAVGEAMAQVAAFGPAAIVLALGVDAATTDPNSPLEVTHAGYREAGRRIGALGVPIVAVQEGGYDPATLGGLVVAALTGVEEGQTNG
jgi:acetoin utilization deacetylase AcuC-like enzyme